MVPGRAQNMVGHDSPAGTTPPWRRKTSIESRWSAFAAIVVVIGAQSWIANSLSLRPVWPYPVVTGVLLLLSLGVYAGKSEPGRLLRRLSVGLVSILVLSNLAATFWLIRGVFVGPKLGGAGLLLAGVALWVANIAIFALAYWELDGGGPEARALGYDGYPDLVFPQMQGDSRDLIDPDWKPMFPDYLFVAVMTATAFSPTEAMPFTRRVKLVMGTEGVVAFAIFTMLVARAVNVAAG